MNLLDIFLLSLALAMDCFAVSIACGVLPRQNDIPRKCNSCVERRPFLWETILRIALLFGFFQSMMPFLGWCATSCFSRYIEAVDHWIAFAMLAFIGVRMVCGAFSKEKDGHLQPQKLIVQLSLAVATSIDALAVGISFACTGYSALNQLWEPLSIIGAGSFALSLAGSLLGLSFKGAILKKIKPELLGGLILIAIGLKILISHLAGA